MSSTRLDLWPHYLEEAINAARAEPFRWGRHDCGLFASDCILAMTGTDPAAEFRGQYQSALGAARILRRLGGLAGLVASRGYPEHATLLYAQAGDVVYLQRGRTEALGICVGSRVAFLGATGLVFAPLTEASRAWRV